jgi:manganese/iron transport system ATP-binding protein
MPVTVRHRRIHDAAAPSVEAQGVTVRYPGALALDDVSFSIRRGERIAVVGPNGAGKSTLLQVIAGLIQPAQGTVLLHGRAPEEHTCVAYVPQHTQVDLSYPVTVYDVAMMGRTGRLGLLRWPRAQDRDQVRECLDVVGAADLAQRKIGELSGGQRQRVFIARALAQEAQIMLMDEPLTGLDVNSQEAILSILDELRRRQVTVLLATHDLNLASRHFDRIMLLNRRLVGMGGCEEVFTPERLASAYGDQLRLVPIDGGTLAVGDTCCGHHYLDVIHDAHG